MQNSRIESQRTEASTSISNNADITDSYLQVDVSDIENDEEKDDFNANYEQPYYSEDDYCHEEDKNQNDNNDTSSINRIYNLFVKFVNKMLEEED